jgi:NAD(P)-dependent dehydrogenase (short-subunit alcohol dehydrogenase family)
MTANDEIRRAALIHGCGSTLGRAVALGLAQSNVRLALYEEGASSAMLSDVREAVAAAGGEAIVIPGDYSGEDRQEALLLEARERLGRLDLLISLLVPDPEIRADDLCRYPATLLARGLAARTSIGSSTDHGAIVHHCFLPAMYADTRLDPYMAMLKAAVVGATRTLCRRLGPSGIRVNCVLTGLLEMPETRAMASPRVLEAKVPVGRWGQPDEAARLIRFLALQPHFMSGQALLMDGGLTAGIQGG